MLTTSWSQLLEEEDVSPEYSEMTLEELSEAFRSARRTRSLDTWTEEKAIVREMHTRFADTVAYLEGADSYLDLGDDLTIEEAEAVLAEAEELVHLIRPVAAEFWGADSALKKNIRARKAFRDLWGKDLPLGKRWSNQWDNDSDYRRVGREAKIIRAWARREGFTVPTRGKLPHQIIDAYVSAHRDKWSEAQVINHKGGPSVEVWCYQCASVHLHGETGEARGKHVGGDKVPHCQHRAAKHYVVSDYTAPYPEMPAEVQQLREDAGL